MNRRQAYALAHPLNDATLSPGETAVYRETVTVRGLLLQSMLAVDR